MNKKSKQDPLRTAAEAELAHAPKPKTKVKPRPAGELLHELQVHQIELEMQNDELRRAQAAIEESRDRYVDLYEFAPVGYLTLTREGMIAEANLTGATLLGMERKKLLQRRFAGFIAAGDSERWHRHFLGVLQRDGQQSCELALQRGDGSRFHARLDYLRREADSASSVRIALTDITEGKRAEVSLRNSETRLQTVVESIAEGIAVSDLDGQLLHFNRAALDLHGFTTLDECRQHMTKFADTFELSAMDGTVWPVDQWPLARILRGESLRDLEVRIRHIQAGWQRVCSYGGTLVRDADGQPLMAVVTISDVTERKRAEQQLRDLTAHLQSVREEEKTSIAREIHDDLGSTLAALKMQAYWLAEDLSANKDAASLLRHVELMVRLADNATNATRRIITGLRPTILDDFGLPAALEWQAAQFHKHTGIECRVNCVVDEGCEKKLDKTQSINLFRIFQETLTNVSRHSGASRVGVEFHHGGEGVALSISDNGCGMPGGHVIAKDSYGIRGMFERVGQLGGKIKFDSPTGGGLNVALILPLPAGNKKGDAI